MPASRRTGARNSLGSEVDALLADFCEANYGAPATQVIRVALREHIAERLEREPEMRRRFDEARRKRLGLGRPKVVPIKSNTQGE